MIFANLLFAISVGATPDPVRVLIADADICELAVMEQSHLAQTADYSKSHDELSKARSDLDKDAPIAVKSAGKSADLKKAVKDFYVAAASYCESPTRSSDGEYKAREKALELELTLSGR